MTPDSKFSSFFCCKLRSIVTFNFSDAEQKLLMRAMSEENLWDQENRTLWREKWNLIDDNIRMKVRITNLEEEKVIFLL